MILAHMKSEEEEKNSCCNVKQEKQKQNDAGMFQKSNFAFVKTHVAKANVKGRIAGYLNRNKQNPNKKLWQAYMGVKQEKK